MPRTTNAPACILIVEEIEEIRDGIEKLLTSDGYRAEPARNEADAISRALRQSPDLVLISMDGHRDAVVQSSRRIRTAAGLTDQVPVVVFCIETVPYGEEVNIGENIYLTRLDNFDQLRAFLTRLLAQPKQHENENENASCV